MWPERHSTCAIGGLNEKGKLACPHWSEYGIVRYEGPEDAELVLIGQSPGAQESQTGYPFVGRSGELLNLAIEQAGLRREDILLVNSICCQPAANSISESSLKLCSSNYCVPCIEEHPRKLVVALGNEAKWVALDESGRPGGITKMLGAIIPSRWGCPALLTCHPALALRRAEYIEVLNSHLLKARYIIEGVYDATPVELMPFRDAGTDIDATIQLLSMVGDLADDGCSRCTVDIETTGLEFNRHHVVGISFAWSGGCFYVPFMEQGTAVWSLDEWVRLYDELKRILHRSFTTDWHNGKFDLKFLQWQYDLDIRVGGDTMLSQQLVDENLPLNLGFLSVHYHNAEPWKGAINHNGAGMEKWQKSHPNMWQDPQAMREYASQDTGYTYLLREPIESKLQEIGCWDLYNTITMPLLGVLHRAEIEGLRPDVPVMHELHSRLSSAMRKEEAKILDMVPAVMRPSFNVGSSDQMRWLLFTHFGIKPTLDTEGKPWDESRGKNPSTSKDALDLMVSHPVTDALIRYRHLGQLDRTFVTGFLERIARDGRVHTSYMWNPRTEGMVKTGRIQSSGPNVMNVPMGLRPMIIARDGWVLLVSDAGQMELRCIAVYSGDEYLKNAFRRGWDIHKMSASGMLGKPMDDITYDERKKGKTFNFALVYGMGDPAVAAELDCSVKEAKEFKSNWFGKMPDVGRWLQAQVEMAQRLGYVVSMTGRRRRLPAIWHDDEAIQAFAARQAKNSPVQGLGADITHLKAIKLTRALDGLPVVPVNMVHDEILLEVREDHVDKVSSILDEILPEPPFPEWDIPLVWDREVHRAWAGDGIDWDKLEEF